MIKNILNFFLIQISIIYVSSIHAKTSVFIYSDDGYPPYSFEEKNKLYGIYADLVKVWNEKLEDYEINLLPIAWKKGLKMLETGEGFALLPLYKRKDRPYIDVYSNEILSENVALFCSSKVMEKTRNKFPKSYKGLKIGINSGFAIIDSLKKAFDRGVIRKNESRNTEVALIRLIMGDIDCYVNDKFSTYFTLKKMKSDKRKFISIKDDLMRYKLNYVQSLTFQYTYIGYGKISDKFPFKEDFSKKLDDIINKMKDNGEVEMIINKYISEK